MNRIRIGELVRGLEKAKGGRKKTADSSVASSKKSTIKQAGLNEKTAERYQQLARSPQ